MRFIPVVCLNRTIPIDIKSFIVDRLVNVYFRPPLILFQ